MRRVILHSMPAVLALSALFYFQVSCIKLPSTTSTNPGLATPYYPSTAAAGESDTVWWDRIRGATSYQLFYTSDGTIPTLSSAYISAGAETSYVHTGLDPTLTYTYAVRAMASGKSSDLSVESWGVQPLPMIHATINFNDYAYDNMGFIYFQVNSSYVPITSSFRTVPAMTDAYSSASFNVTLDHDNLWGYSVFKDMDYNGVLSTGDTVWGNDTTPGHYGFVYWLASITTSKTFSKSFDTTFATHPHVY